MKGRILTTFVVLVLLICLGVMAYSLFQLHSRYETYQDSRETYAEIVDMFFEQAEETQANLTTFIPQIEGSGALSLPSVNWAELRQSNPDVIGWLYCPGTVINYPVVQGGDNLYYLTHLIDGTEGVYGTLFLDCKSDLESRKLLVYGHHMKDGGMFGSLQKYQKQSYYDLHPVIYFLTPYQNYEVRLFCGCTTTVKGEAYERDFVDCSFSEWVRMMRKQSDFHSEVQAQEDDRVMTFSTCAYSLPNARYVVMGVLRTIK